MKVSNLILRQAKGNTYLEARGKYACGQCGRNGSEPTTFVRGVDGSFRADLLLVHPKTDVEAVHACYGCGVKVSLKSA